MPECKEKKMSGKKKMEEELASLGKMRPLGKSAGKSLLEIQGRLAEGKKNFENSSGRNNEKSFRCNRQNTKYCKKSSEYGK